MKLIASVIVTCALAFAGLAQAGSIAEPTGKPILVISGKIKNTNVDGSAQFDREMLEALGMEELQTSTPWFEGTVKFEGVTLDKLMALVGAEGTTVTASALNDYATTIPIDDFEKFGVLLALKRNGQYMDVRDKGPLFIIYPFDSKPALQSQTYYGRSAWQLARLNIE